MKKLQKLACVLLFLPVVAAAAAQTGKQTAAQTIDIRPGLWEFRSTQLKLGGLPDLTSQMSQLQQHIKNLPAETRRMVEQQMAERGVSLGKDGAVRSCITPEQARQDNIFSGKTEGSCTLLDVSKGQGWVRGRLSCTDPRGEGEFAATIASPERFATRMSLRSERGDMQMETEARWVGERCEAAAAGKR